MNKHKKFIETTLKALTQLEKSDKIKVQRLKAEFDIEDINI